jgi:hypothetical protein
MLCLCDVSDIDVRLRDRTAIDVCVCINGFGSVAVHVCIVVRVGVCGEYLNGRRITSFPNPMVVT